MNCNPEARSDKILGIFRISTLSNMNPGLKASQGIVRLEGCRMRGEGIKEKRSGMRSGLGISLGLGLLLCKLI
jgi:hypothetical protein